MYQTPHYCLKVAKCIEKVMTIFEHIHGFQGYVRRSADGKCEREAVTVIVIYNPGLHSSQSIFEAG